MTTDQSAPIADTIARCLSCPATFVDEDLAYSHVEELEHPIMFGAVRRDGGAP
jgi:hypothetical protein